MLQPYDVYNLDDSRMALASIGESVSKMSFLDPV